MKRRWIQSVVLVVALAVPKGGAADVIYLKGAGRLEGRIIEQTDESIVVDIGAGTMTVSRDRVERIEEGRSALDDYRDQEAALDPGDSEGWLELANWASDHALGTQARQAYQQVLKTDPENPEANQALGRVQLDGRWVSAEESYRARGYVQFEGQWMTPAEQQSILDERAAWTEAQRARYEADARAREAEDLLVVDTANFSDNSSPYQNGVPSGAGKHVVERYRLGADGTRLTVEFMLEDPEYIVGSMTHARDLIYSPQIEMTPFNCDLEATRPFLPQ